MLTKDDLNQIERIVATALLGVGKEFAGVREEIYGLRDELKQDIVGVRQELGDDIARVVDYMHTNMATKAELSAVKVDLDGQITRMIAVMATKQDFRELKNDIAELREDFEEFLVISDKTAVALDTLRLEYAAVSVQQARQVEWMYKVADKVEIPYEY